MADLDDRLALLAHWIGVMEGSEEKICTAEQGITMLRILDAIYKSARTGAWVRFD